MRTRSFLLAYLAGMLIMSCSPKDKVKDNISKMTEKAVLIDSGKMKTWLPDSALAHGEKKAFTLVVFADSTQCSPCFINGLKEWNDMLAMEQDKKGNVRFLFIIEPRKGDETLLREKLQESGFKHPVLIDGKSLFRNANPHIPQEMLYHTFLLDRENRIVLVGNPLHNEQVRKLLYQRLKSV